MPNIRIDWKDPTVRADGSALSAAEISAVNIGMRVAGAPDFTPFASVGAGVQTFTVTDLPPGDYEFNLVVVDTQSPAKSGAAVVVSATIPVPVPVLAAPGSVTDATATVV